MAEENHTTHTTTAATPASNQNLIIGIIMGAIVLLLLLLVITQQFNKGTFGLNNTVDTEAEADKKKLAELNARNDALRLTSNSGQNPELLIAQIKTDTDTLGRLINASASDAAMLRAAQDNANVLSNSVTNLNNQLNQYKAAASRAQSLETELNNARAALAGSVDRATFDTMKNQLNLAQTEQNRLQTELNRLLANQGNMVDRNTYALVKKELDELRQANAALRAENQRLIAENAGSKLFVSSDQLSPRASSLYRELNRIENDNHRARNATYNRIDNQLNASIGETITFKTGSDAIGREHEAHLKTMALQAPENTFFLVVGYASPSGDSKTNEKLSSSRATRVASMVNYLKKSGQAVQAVYLGEGKRFGPTDAPNQVCEVWAIRP